MELVVLAPHLFHGTLGFGRIFHYLKMQYLTKIDEGWKCPDDTMWRLTANAMLMKMNTFSATQSPRVQPMMRGSWSRSVQTVSSTDHMWRALIAALGKATTGSSWGRHTPAASSRKALTDWQRPALCRRRRRRRSPRRRQARAKARPSARQMSPASP